MDISTTHTYTHIKHEKSDNTKYEHQRENNTTTAMYKKKSEKSEKKGTRGIMPKLGAAAWALGIKIGRSASANLSDRSIQNRIYVGPARRVRCSTFLQRLLGAGLFLALLVGSHVFQATSVAEPENECVRSPGR